VQSAPPASSAETEDAGARIDLARARLRMLEDESRRISELGPKMVELRAAQDDFRRAKELYKDRIIADAVYTNKQFQFEQLKANLRADSAETKRIFEERSKAAKLRSAEEDLKRASELLKDKIISEASYEQRKLNFELLRTNDPSARIRLQLRAAQEDFKRASELYKEKIIPDAVYKQKKLELELLEAQLRDDASGGWRESLETTENELNHAKDDLKRMMKLRASDGGTNNPATKQSGLAGALLKSDDDPGKITEIKLRLAEQELELLKIGEKEGLVRQADLLDVNRAVELLRAKLKGSEPAR
jgi:multidrug resistance efflux pump